MVYARRYQEDTDDLCDQTKIPGLWDAPEKPQKRRVGAVRGGGADSPWGLARALSDALPRTWGVMGGLDDAETRRAAGYMSDLLNEHQLSPERIRSMITVFARRCVGQTVNRPVGYFWMLRRELEGQTVPVEEKSYSGWNSPASSVSDSTYAGWTS